MVLTRRTALRANGTVSSSTSPAVAAEVAGIPDPKASSKRWLPVILNAMQIYAVFAIISIAIMCSPLQRHLTYMRHLKNPFQELILDELEGMPIENLELNVAEQIVKGWYIKGHADNEHDEDVILYLHGNSGTRASHHRVELYKLLHFKFNMSVVVIDYRGFGDSTSVTPTESSIVEDALIAFQWIETNLKVKASRTHVWGHSLGSGIATALVHSLETRDVPIVLKSLVLESPFLNFFTAMMSYPLSIPLRLPGVTPLLDKYFLDRFPSDERVDKLRTPTIILHGTLDPLVPFWQGRQLAKIASTRDSGTELVDFVSFSNVGHNYIVSEEEQLVSALSHFWDKTHTIQQQMKSFGK